MLFLLRRRGRMSTKELSNIFKVSEVSIRNDLNELARQGLIVRTYGGAAIAGAGIAVGGSGYAVDMISRNDSTLEKLGELAANLVRNGDVVYVDSGVATASLVESLKTKRDCTVLTNSLFIAQKLGPMSQLAVYLVGGRINAESMSIIAEAQIIEYWIGKHHNIAISLMGAMGATPQTGYTDSRPDDLELKKAVLKHAGQKVLVMDSSRWGGVSLCTFAGFSDIDLVITDDPPRDMLEYLSSQDTQVIQLRKGARRRKTASSPYARYSELREQAMLARPYEGQPGAKKKIAFANGMGVEPFCADLEQSFREHARLAGFSEDDIHIFDNRYDFDTALANCDQVLELKPDIFVQFQVHSKANNIIASKLEQLGIPILALETPVPSATFIGTNNWQAGIMAGEFACGLVEKKMGGIDNLDLVVPIQMATDAEINLFRIEGFVAALLDRFGGKVEGKIVRETASANTQQGARVAMDRILTKYPAARNLAIATVNNECMEGVIDSLKQFGRFDCSRLILVSHGCDDIGRLQLKRGDVDGSVAYFPEKYGEYIIPAACAILEAQPLPPYIYVDVKLLTAANLRDYYPLA